jgi:hypothetical protein
MDTITGDVPPRDVPPRDVPSRDVPSRDVPPGLLWLEDFVPLIITLSTFGGSITFSIIPSIGDTQPPNQSLSAQDVRAYLALAWLFFTLALGFSAAAQPLLKFQRPAIYAGFGETTAGDPQNPSQDRWYNWVRWIFCSPFLSLILQTMILLAFFFVALVVVAYVEVVGWVAVAFIGVAFVGAVYVWLVQVCC